MSYIVDHTEKTGSQRDVSSRPGEMQYDAGARILDSFGEDMICDVMEGAAIATLHVGLILVAVLACVNMVAFCSCDFARRLTFSGHMKYAGKRL
jgi:hypothetical protein